MRHPFRTGTRRPILESLEKRDVPATWGIAWPGADHLTLSFMPDGSSVQGQSSQLFQTLDSQLGVGKWTNVIIDALQTWAVNSNINLGVVADGGQPLGVAGPAQGDARFGDIRVSAIPLPAGVLAITAPYDPGTGTVSGDMILNSNANFGSSGGHDLFSVALHEAGHSYGLDDSSNPSSIMYPVYTGPRAGLEAAAIPALQALYGGPRDVAGRNGDPDASNPKKPVDVSSLITAAAGSNAIAGDLASVGAMNYYQFKAPTSSTASAGLDIQVQTAGISRLIPRVTVLDSAGWQVAVASADNADDGITTHLLGLSPGKTYSLRLDAPSDDIYSVGSYMLSLAPTGAPGGNSAALKSAVSLDTKGSSSSSPATGMVPINAATQVDYYYFTTPSSVTNGLTAQAQAFGIGLVSPQLAVLNSQGDVIGQATTTDPSNPTMSVLVSSVQPNTKYYLKVTGGVINATQVGMYQAAVSYTASATPAPAAVLETPWLGSVAAKVKAPNTSPANVATLQTPAGYAKGSFYTAMQGIGARGVANYFAIDLPKTKQVAYMTLSVQALNGSGFQPWVTVTDGLGNAVPTRVLTQEDGISVVQVPYDSVTKNYVVKVAASGANGGGSTGNYYLRASFGAVASSLATLAAGRLGPLPAGSTAAEGATGVVTIPSTQLYEFVLTGNPANSTTDAMLRLTVTDSSGKVVATLTSLAAEAASLNLLLGTGQYSFRVDVYSPSRATIPALAYNLSGTYLTDPIRGVPSPSGGSSGTTA